jgi:tetraacyldisaccharide 4'-kinase
MKLSVDTAVRLGRVGVAIGHTWRFRDADRPPERATIPQAPVILACWHEYLLSFALLGKHRGIASLSSQHGDGEIITRIVDPLGFHMARGSSSRGGFAGFRELLRAAADGRSIYLTTDGPRGPRHTCQPGVARLAKRTGFPIVPMAMAATSGFRLDSWDRQLVPAPGARVFVAFGDPIDVGSDDDATALARIEHETNRMVRRCEAVAREARWGRPAAIQRSAPEATPDRGARSSGPLFRAIESRIRRAWLRRPPPLDLRAASVGFRGLRAARHALYDAGIISAGPPAIPVVSVGGITVGGAGKTPLASEVAGWIMDAGARAAVLTRGYADELRLHRALQPRAVVMGHRDRQALTWRAAAEGADVAVLDDGFQHRRLARSFDLVAIDRDALRRTNGAPLPAGPFRESVGRAVRVADALVLIGREPRDEAVIEWEKAWVADVGPRTRPAIATLEADAPELVRKGTGDQPTVALTGVMKPNLFFDFVRSSCPRIERCHALPDHGVPGADLPELLEAAAAGGFVMTRKDYVRLSGILPRDIGVWVVPERLVWHEGESPLRTALLEAVLGAGRC